MFAATARCQARPVGRIIQLACPRAPETEKTTQPIPTALLLSGRRPVVQMMFPDGVLKSTQCATGRIADTMTPERATNARTY